MGEAGAQHPGRYVGIDLGGTNMQIGLVDLERLAGESADHAEIVARRKLKTKSEEGLERVLDRMVAGIEDICNEVRMRPRDLAGLGIGAPSPVDPYRGVVLQAVNLRWNNVGLCAMLEARLGTRVFLDNDVNVALVGEARFGAGKGADPLLGVWVGTGVGGAVMFGGELHYGKHFSAGEIGQMWVDAGAGPGLRTLEQLCSRTALVNRLRQLILSNHPSMVSEMVKGDLDKIKSRVLGEAYQAGDALVVELCDHAAWVLGAHIGSLHTLLSFERVVMGGGLTEALGGAWVEKIASAARRVAFPDVARGLDVQATMLEDDAGVLGAAVLAAERRLHPRFARSEPSTVGA